MGSLDGMEFLASNLVQQWHSQPRKLRIIHIGAGATGLCCAFKMERQLTDYELVCYEKNPSIGGTWYENTYPGCACDVPAHCYTYTFEPNPNWSAYYAGSSEILKYFQDFHDKYNLSKYIKLEHKVLGAEWQEAIGQWKVEIEHNGQIFFDFCHVLINASGLLNKWKWPEIEGLRSFRGTLLHSAAWDHSVDLTGKRVAVLGTGSSAIQIIPQIQPKVASLTSFMRGNTWIASPMPKVEIEVGESTKLQQAKAQINEKIDNSEPITNTHGQVNGDSSAKANGLNDTAQTNSASADSVELQLDPVTAALNDAQRTAAVGEPMVLEATEAIIEKVSESAPLEKDIRQHFYTPGEIKKLNDDPEYHLHYRKQIEFAMNSGFAIFYKNSDASKMAQQWMAAEMARRLNYHPELTKRLIPDWPLGCRRLTPGDGYLEALIKPNVQPVYSDITLIDKTGLHTEDGKYYEVDAIICATGYDMAWTPFFKLKGLNGVEIQSLWKPVPNCYLGLAAPGFPNYYVMNGPRGNLCNGTVIPCFETQLEYVISAAKKMQTDRIKAMDVKEDIAFSLQRYVDNWHEGSVWSGECKSWYKNNTVNGKIMCWGGSSIHYLKSIKTPRWEHFNIRYLDDNPWGFLGNGRTKGETLNDFEMMVPYMRNEDVPWVLE